jgi:hypothetical protein
MNAFMLVLAVALWALGAGAILFVKRRAFYRRNVAGLEQFRGYGNMLVTRLFEAGMMVGALLCIIAGTAVMFKSGA